ncbi:hypothetical protein SMD44_p10010 (plasmid) [Streptomyces alboflavus]|uniref:Uncharacterized protein n=1 Tax=Streptomyces alboflavus TaxID=67267 RepID=A0A291W4J7_9ACTN|nr:hypothetical protein [Streptomyces alboflavus]ATM24509.1 hypothetical protein SMD44_p10010 [Streptomyces alboflavus]
MTDPQPPDGFTLDDWLELISFYNSVERNGRLEAAENYPPRFKSPGFPAPSDRFGLVVLYEEHESTVEQWCDETGPDEVTRLLKDYEYRVMTPLYEASTRYAAAALTAHQANENDPYASTLASLWLEAGDLAAHGKHLETALDTLCASVRDHLQDAATRPTGDADTLAHDRAAADFLSQVDHAKNEAARTPSAQ